MIFTRCTILLFFQKTW